MATVIPAKAIGVDDQIGILQPGARADVVLFDQDIVFLLGCELGLVIWRGVTPFRAR